MAVTKWKLDKYEHLLTDDIVKKALDDLTRTKQRMADYLYDNHERKHCPVCKRDNIRYEHFGIVCNDCGWQEEIEINYNDLPLARNFISALKQRFGQQIGKEKSTERLTQKSIKKLPINLVDFGTGEYTDVQVEFLKERFNDILETENVDFDKKDLAVLHFLVIQELKIKDLYRQEAISNTKATDKDFISVKKDEIKLYNNLRDDLEEIIKQQKTNDKELSVYDKINSEFKNKDIDDMLERMEEEREKKKEELDKSNKRRKKVLQGDIDFEEEIEEAVGDVYDGDSE